MDSVVSGLSSVWFSSLHFSHIPTFLQLPSGSSLQCSSEFPRHTPDYTHLSLGDVSSSSVRFQFIICIQFSISKFSPLSYSVPVFFIPHFSKDQHLSLLFVQKNLINFYLFFCLHVSQKYNQQHERWDIFINKMSEKILKTRLDST